MKSLSSDQRHGVIRCLCGRASITAITGMKGVAKNAIQKLTRELGQLVLEFQDHVLRKLTYKRVELNEVSEFGYAKDKNLRDQMRGSPGVGSTWIWTCDPVFSAHS